MKDIKYKEKSTGSTIKLSFNITTLSRKTYLGDKIAKHTQCLIFKDGFLIGFNTIIKSHRDPDNEKFAVKLVAERCLKTIEDSELRENVRKVLDKELIDIYGY